MRRMFVTMGIVLGLAVTAFGQVKLDDSPAQRLTPLMPDSPGHYNVQFRAKAKDKSLLCPCRLFIPNDYGKTKDPSPLILFLHSILFDCPH